MSIINHAFAAYMVQPGTGEFDFTLDWAYYTEGEVPDAEQMAAAGFDKFAPNRDGNAVTQYRVEFIDEAQAEQIARTSRSFDEETASEIGMVAMAMDTIEWDLNWIHPAVTIIRENNHALRMHLLAARGNKILDAFHWLGSEGTVEVAGYWDESLGRYQQNEAWEIGDFGLELSDALDGIDRDSAVVVVARQRLSGAARSLEVTA